MIFYFDFKKYITLGESDINPKMKTMDSNQDSYLKIIDKFPRERKPNTLITFIVLKLFFRTYTYPNYNKIISVTCAFPNFFELLFLQL